MPKPLAKNMVFADANIPLELSLPDRRHRPDVESVLGSITEPVAVSTLTAHLMWYFGRKDAIPDEDIRTSVAAYKLLDFVAEDYIWAVANEQGKDFEDALQVAIALRSGCSSFMTLDKRLADAYAQVPLKFIVPGY